MQEESDPLIENEFTDASARLGHFMKNHDGEPINLSGSMIYSYSSLKSAFDKFTGENPCDVEVVFLNKQEIQLNVIEHTPPPEGDRFNSLYGKLTQGGRITFSYPVPLIVFPDGFELKVTDIINGHLGCDLFGPGTQKGTLNYNGFFDGERLYAPAFFMLQCDKDWTDINEIFPTPVDGPVKAKWAFDLTID